MTTHVETLIIGAGQAGLALSRCLTDLGKEHVLLERGRVAERWRSERWDSFTLLTPSWQTRLPGHRYDGADPEGFLSGREVVAMFDAYARSFNAPVETGVSVTRVSPGPSGWTILTSRGTYEATNVVVATGHQDRPRVPAFAARLPGDLAQLHTSEYRNPAQLPSGAVLVVGAGPSGQQIAGELAQAGRRVLIAAGQHRWLPRRHRDRDTFWWMERMGLMERAVDSLPDPASARRGGAAVLAGQPGDLNLHALVRHGVRPLGRLLDVDGARLRFGTELAATVADADAHAARFRASVDAFADGGRVVGAAPAGAVPSWATDARRSLDVARDGVGTVVWATGFGRDYRWLHAPVFDTDGEPLHRRGITPAPGLTFLGLRWQHRRKSHFIDGVGDDAAFLAEWIAASRPAPWASAARI